MGAGASGDVEPAERVREARDLLAQLRGDPGARARCREALARHEREGTEATREALRAAYEAMPAHTRPSIGDMDRKDWPIRRALYGPQPDDVEHEGLDDDRS